MFRYNHNMNRFLLSKGNVVAIRQFVTSSSSRHNNNNILNKRILCGVSNNNVDNTSSTIIQQRREYHATSKKEILPLIVGVGTLAVIGKYSYRALKHMDNEWEDYQWELQQYERNLQQNTKKKSTTIGIDIGTFYTKFANDRSLLVNREGSRYTFSGLVVEDESCTLVGQQAFTKYYERRHSDASSVSMAADNDMTTTRNDISVVLQSALTETLKRNNINSNNNNRSFVIAAPPNATKWNYYDTATKKLVLSNNEEVEDRILIPEPVAAVWGAQVTEELPPTTKTEGLAVLVIDVGATDVTYSVVQRDVVVGSNTISNVGGNLYVEAIVDLLCATSSELRNDGMALQRIYEAAHSAAIELNARSSTEIHIPYVGMNLETREPKHLNERTVRSVVEKCVTEKFLEQTFLTEKFFSSHIKPSSSLSNWFASSITKLFEDSKIMPMELTHVLVVGGGTKHPMIQTSILDGWRMLSGGGDSGTTKFVLSQRPNELVAIGASSMLQNYTYDTQIGLVRRE